jgi:methylenetetrahydrofolate--tRNA-(uracil-5-)-methyltransferase
VGETFQPMNVNFGLFPPLAVPIKAKAERNPTLARRALEALDAWIATSERALIGPCQSAVVG